jgi:hypothetical protein
MIARLDHHPMLTALLALTTAALVVVVITLATLLITLPQTASPTSGSIGGKPAAATHKGMGAGGESYAMYDYYSHQPQPAQKGDSLAPNQGIPSAHYGF